MNASLLPPHDPERLAAGYLVFQRGPQDQPAPWWWHVARACMSWSHCWWMEWAGDRWLVLEATGYDVQAIDLGGDPDLPAQLADAGAAVLEVRRERHGGWHHRGLTTCVSLTKMRLGIKAWWVVTPRQLHDYLLEEGQREVNHGRTIGAFG